MILLDSNYIVSFLVDTEKNHKRALELSKKIREEDVVITNAILIEAINLLTKKLYGNVESINDIFEFIKSEFRIIYATEELTEKGMKILIKYNATIGLADAINIVVMEELKIHEIVSFDPDFDNKDMVVRVY